MWCIAPLLRAYCLEKAFSTIFHNYLNMCFVHTIPMELKYTLYYSSPDAFSYTVSTPFLYGEYKDTCLIT